jgi:nucleosome binding factor SPN SPT16 subunit
MIISTRCLDAEGAAQPEVFPDIVLGLGDAKIGTLPKDKAQGKFVEEWNRA